MKSWNPSYVAICAAVLLAVFVALVILVSIVDLGLTTHGMIALFLGAILTIALTMVLMGLVFMSDTKGQDESAYSAGRANGPEAPPEQESGEPNVRG